VNTQETIVLIQTLKEAGVVRFKSLEHDIEFGQSTKRQLKESPTQLKESPEGLAVENKEATEKLKDLISTLKMSDEELANQLFPDGAM
jgi:uncharacterized protein YaaN involved in tellurite resistance